MPGGRLRNTNRPSLSLITRRSPVTSSALTAVTVTPGNFSPPGPAVTVPVIVTSCTACAHALADTRSNRTAEIAIRLIAILLADAIAGWTKHTANPPHRPLRKYDSAY